MSRSRPPYLPVNSRRDRFSHHRALCGGSLLLPVPSVHRGRSGPGARRWGYFHAKPGGLRSFREKGSVCFSDELAGDLPAPDAGRGEFPRSAGGSAGESFLSRLLRPVRTEIPSRRPPWTKILSRSGRPGSSRPYRAGPGRYSCGKWG